MSAETSEPDAQNEGSDARPQEPLFGFWRSVLFSSIILCGFFTCAELGVRAWAHSYRGDLEQCDDKAGTFVLTPGDYGDYVRINSEGFVGLELEPDRPDLWRVYALGDSCTFGGGNYAVTYSARLRDELARDGVEGVRYEVVNAGIEGLSSELALRRLESVGPPLKPDAVTIYIGWNDLMKGDPSGQQQTSAWGPVFRVMDRLWLVKGMRKLMFFYVRPRLYPPATGPSSYTGRFDDFHPVVFEENLRKIVASARALGAQPVLATLPTVVRPDMSAGELLQQNIYFPYFPSAYAVGDFLSLVKAYNGSIRRVAEEEDVPVSDLARAFARIPDPGMLFTDTVHLTHEGHAMIARELRATLRAARLDGSSLAVD